MSYGRKTVFSVFTSSFREKSISSAIFSNIELQMDSIESLSYFKGRLEPFFSISILIREQMAPKKGTVASKTDFFPFPGKRDIDPGFFRDAPRASLDELERAKFRRAALSRLACRSCTNRQTETKHEINGLLGLGCKASRSLGRGPTRARPSTMETQ